MQTLLINEIMLAALMTNNQNLMNKIPSIISQLNSSSLWGFGVLGSVGAGAHTRVLDVGK